MQQEFLYIGRRKKMRKTLFFEEKLGKMPIDRHEKFLKNFLMNEKNGFLCFCQEDNVVIICVLSNISFEYKKNIKTPKNFNDFLTIAWYHKNMAVYAFYADMRAACVYFLEKYDSALFLSYVSVGTRSLFDFCGFLPLLIHISMRDEHKRLYSFIFFFFNNYIGVRNPVPDGEKAPVSMFKKSIYIINVFIIYLTDALRGLSINKIGDYVYSTTFKYRLLVLFFDLFKKNSLFYLNNQKYIKFI